MPMRRSWHLCPNGGSWLSRVYRRFRPPEPRPLSDRAICVREKSPGLGRAQTPPEARTRAITRTHHQRAFDLPVRHVTALGKLVGDVIETNRKEIREHDLGNRL